MEAIIPLDDLKISSTSDPIEESEQSRQMIPPGR
jgi:hypothetical protein